MYSNSKEQISLEEAYRRVHLNEEVEETESDECECGGEEECNCNDHTDMCDECHRPVDKCDCGKYSKKKDELATEAFGLEKFTGFAQQVYDAFVNTSGPESFHDRMMYWVITALAAAVVAAGAKGAELGYNKLKEYYKNLDEQSMKQNIEYLLKQDGVITAIKHILQLEKEHRDQDISNVINTQLKTAIEIAMKEKGTPDHLVPPAFATMQHALGRRKNQTVSPIPLDKL